MNQLQIFNNQEFGHIRTIESDNKTLFVASDVAKCLGYQNTSKAINDHCRCITKRYIPHPQNPDKTIEVNVISEGDIYRLAAKSELPGAEKFESWIFNEVIPSIRKHGTYMTPSFVESALNNPDTMITFLQKYKEEQQKRIEAEKQIEAQKPKVIFADAVSISKTSILIGDLAKLIKQNGYDIGQKRLFKWLRENGYLMQYGESYNMPTQKSMDLGLFEVKEGTVINPDDSVRITKTTKVTGKGQIYFINKFIEKTA